MSSTNAAAAAARLASVSGHLVSAPKAGDRFEFDYGMCASACTGLGCVQLLTPFFLQSLWVAVLPVLCLPTGSLRTRT